MDRVSPDGSIIVVNKAERELMNGRPYVFSLRGETTYKLTNINRAEPAKSLFEVPSDYTIKEGPSVGPKIAPLQRKKTQSPE